MAIDLKAVEQLANDQSSLKAAAGLAKPAKWSGVGGSADGALIWGECAGSGANPSGTVKFYLCFGTTTGCTDLSPANQVGTATLNNSGNASYVAVAPTPPGNYCFAVSYAGDAIYAGSVDTTSTDQCFVIA